MSWRRIASLAAGVILIGFFLDRDQFTLADLFLLRCGHSIGMAVIEGLAIAGTGWLARRRRDSSLAMNFIVGYPIFGTICFLIGSIRIDQGLMLTAVWTGFAAGIWMLIERWRKRERQPSRPLPLALWLMLPLVFGCAWISAQAPPSSLDELAYHLAIPHSWVADGRAGELPLISHSYFPLGVESADLPLLATLDPIEGGIASHFLHLAAALATFVLLFRYIKRRAAGSDGVALLVTTAIATTPALLVTAGWSLVDWNLLGIITVLLLAVDDGDDATMAAAVAAGLLTKYTFIPVLLIVLIDSKRWRGAIPGFIAGSVFFIRNVLLTGNPVAPFFSSLTPHVSGYRQLPLWNYIFDSAFLDESLGISLIVLCVMTSGRRAWAFLIFTAMLLLTMPSSRILLPFLLIPAMSAVTELGPRSKTRPLLAAILVIGIGLQLWLVSFLTDRSQAFGLFAGRFDDRQYLIQSRPSYGATEWINANLPAGSRTLVVGLNETYWFWHSVRGGGNFDSVRMSSYLQASTPEALRERLRGDGITHVAVVQQVLGTTVPSKRAERDTALTPAAKRMMTLTLDHFAASVASHDNVTLFRLQ